MVTKNSYLYDGLKLVHFNSVTRSAGKNYKTTKFKKKQLKI